MMRIQLNGEPHTLSEAATIEALLSSLGVDARQVAVERNRTIIPKSQYTVTHIHEGDVLELVEFIGGG